MNSQIQLNLYSSYASSACLLESAGTIATLGASALLDVGLLLSRPIELGLAKWSLVALVSAGSVPVYSLGSLVIVDGF
jgi:hypothetical protein